MDRGIVVWVGVLCLCAGSLALGQSRRERARSPRRTTPSPSQVNNPPAATTQVSGCGFAVGEHLVITSAVVVQDGRDLQVETTDGMARKATLVRRDQASGLAVLRTEGDALGHVGMAESFDGGEVECFGLIRPSLFQPIAESVAGSATKPTDAAGEKWTVDLKAAPRLAGAPLIVGGSVVGVTLAADAEQMHKVPSATPRQIAVLLTDLKLPANRHTPPASAIVRVTCTKTAP